MLRLYFARLTIPRLPQLYAAIDGALDGADLLVTHPAASLVGRMACEVRGIPWIVGDLFPMLTPTVTRAPALFRIPDPKGPVSRAVVRRVWRFGASPLGRWLSSERDFVRFRRSLGLDTEKGHAVYGRLSPHHNVVLVSPHYFPPAADWGPDYRMTGFVHWTGSVKTLPDEVERFLASGEPPVVVTLGTSAAGADPEIFSRAAAALDGVGMRGLFLTSAAAHSVGLYRDASWPYVPLEPLLPRCRAIVHSGAQGTSALALAAGLPSVIIPQLFDQAWHGRRQVELGTGVLVGRKREVPSIEAALVKALDDDHRARARDFADVLGHENGLDDACDEIEAFLQRG